MNLEVTPLIGISIFEQQSTSHVQESASLETNILTLPVKVEDKSSIEERSPFVQDDCSTTQTSALVEETPLTAQDDAIQIPPPVMVEKSPLSAQDDYLATQMTSLFVKELPLFVQDDSAITHMPPPVIVEESSLSTQADSSATQMPSSSMVEDKLSLKELQQSPVDNSPVVQVLPICDSNRLHQKSIFHKY